MSFIHVVGRVTTELELKVSQRGTAYVRFSLEEILRNGRHQRFQVWAYGWDAEYLVKRKVRTGCLLEVSGPVFIEEYTERDGVTPGIRLKIIYKDGGPVSEAASNSKSKKNPTTTAKTPAPNCQSPSTEIQIDGEREPLPE